MMKKLKVFAMVLLIPVVALLVAACGSTPLTKTEVTEALNGYPALENVTTIMEGEDLETGETFKMVSSRNGNKVFTEVFEDGVSVSKMYINYEEDKSFTSYMQVEGGKYVKSTMTTEEYEYSDLLFEFEPITEDIFLEDEFELENLGGGKYKILPLVDSAEIIEMEVTFKGKNISKIIVDMSDDAMSAFITVEVKTVEITLPTDDVLLVD